MSDSRARTAFAALIAAQAAHSVEEYVFRLYDVFGPPRFLSGLISSDRAFGFALLNVAIVLFGVWCYLARVRPGHPWARVYALAWSLVECANGLGHLALAAARGGYFPGAATAPLLLAAAGYVAYRLRDDAR
jgi:hypothetical protein